MTTPNHSLHQTALSLGLLPSPVQSRFSDKQIELLTRLGFKPSCLGHFYRNGVFMVAADPQIPGEMLINSSQNLHTMWVHDEQTITAFMSQAIQS